MITFLHREPLHLLCWPLTSLSIILKIISAASLIDLGHTQKHHLRATGWVFYALINIMKLFSSLTKQKELSQQGVFWPAFLQTTGREDSI